MNSSSFWLPLSAAPGSLSVISMSKLSKRTPRTAVSWSDSSISSWAYNEKTVRSVVVSSFKMSKTTELGLPAESIPWPFVVNGPLALKFLESPFQLSVKRSFADSLSMYSDPKSSVCFITPASNSATRLPLKTKF